MLRADLRSGRWHDRHGWLLDLDQLDCGLRLLVGAGTPGGTATTGHACSGD